MSVVGWHGCEGVFLRRGNSFEREILFQYFPEEIGESLFERFKRENGIFSIEDIHRIFWDNLAVASGESAVLRALFKLDILFCKGYLQLQFGSSDAPPLARLQVSGNPVKMPIKRVAWTGKTVLLSRFAYMHRDGTDLVLERPLSCLRCIVDSPQLSQILFACSQKATPGELLVEECPTEYRPSLMALLEVLCERGFLESLSSEEESQTRMEENKTMALWDFHDLLFHSENSYYHGWGSADKGFGKAFPYIDHFTPLSGLHPGYPGEKIALAHPPQNLDVTDITLEKALKERKSCREYDVSSPITKEEIGILLSRLYRGGSRLRKPLPDGSTSLPDILDSRSYPSGGSLYDQEIYFSVFRCKGLEQGFYHYDAPPHALVQIPFPEKANYARKFQEAKESSETPDVILYISSRFGRMSWKYRQMSYGVILRNVGCMYQTIYLIACSMNLGVCGRGACDTNLFTQLSSRDPYEEGAVGELFLGREA